MIIQLTYWSICVFKGAVLSSNFNCLWLGPKFSMIFLFKVIFRVDRPISITDQLVSSNGTVLLSNFIFLFLLIEEIR